MKGIHGWLLGSCATLALPWLHGCLAMVDFKETCVTDSACASGLFCNDGQCTDTCSDNSNCGSGKTCDASSHKCVTIPSCTASNQASICGKYACDTSTSRCYSDCQGPNSALDSSRCNTSTICAYDYTCAYSCDTLYASVCGAYVCDTNLGYCRNYCTSSADCGSGYACNSNLECSR